MEGAPATAGAGVSPPCPPAVSASANRAAVANRSARDRASAVSSALHAGVPLLAAGGRDAEGWTAAYRVVGAGFALEGLVFGSSAALGFRKTSRCREALRRLAERGTRPAAAAPPR
jgi:hypothetical protein